MMVLGLPIMAWAIAAAAAALGVILLKKRDEK